MLEVCCERLSPTAGCAAPELQLGLPAAGTRFLPPARLAEHQTLMRDVSDARGAACQTQEAPTCCSRSRLGREAAGVSL